MEAERDFESLHHDFDRSFGARMQVSPTVQSNWKALRGYLNQQKTTFLHGVDEQLFARGFVLMWIARRRGARRRWGRGFSESMRDNGPKAG